MGFRFFKRVNVVPGLRINFSSGLPSVSVGHHGLGWLTLGRRGVRATVGGMGTGLFYTSKIPPETAPSWSDRLVFVLVILLAAWPLIVVLLK